MQQNNQNHHKIEEREQRADLSAAALRAPIPKAGAHALDTYAIDDKINKARAIALKLHAIQGLYPDDRQLLVRLQRYLKEIKQLNGYERNHKLDLFPP